MSQETVLLQSFSKTHILGYCIPKQGYGIGKFFQIALSLILQLIDLNRNNTRLSAVTPYVINCLDEYQFQDSIAIINWLNDLKSNNSALFNKQVVRYLAPEETGRIAYNTDNRSQLYSLGIIFFELLSGRTPFSQDNLLNLVHAHLTEIAPPLTTIKPTTPIILSTIISKLLNKRPRERYQTLEGLLYDLEKIQKCLRKDNTSEFELCTHDYPETLFISPNFVGRKKHFKSVTNWLQKHQGSASTCLHIHGSAGIGKTTFIQEQYKALVSDNIVLLYGKHSTINRSSAYNGIIAAISSYLDEYNHNKSMALKLKNKILQLVGINAYLLTDLCFPLKKLLGKQPTPKNQNYTDNKHRFHVTLAQFLAALSGENEPLFLCLDDMQWADQPTLDILKYLISNTSLPFLKIILLHRDNEPANDSFTDLLNTINSYTTTYSLHLKPLTLNNTRTYLLSCLINSKNLPKVFFEILHGRSQGNPLFLKLFIQNLYENDILKFTKDLGWQCDIEQLKTVKSDLKISDIILQKLTLLTKNIQTVLMYAACLGNKFVFSEIYELSDFSETDILLYLSKAVSEGFVFQIGTEYHFVHDHIHEGCISLLSSKQKTEIYYKIATWLFENSKSSKCIKTDLSLIRQINISCNNIKNQHFNILLAKLNLKAAEEAEFISAYKSTAEYANFAISILPVNHWKAYYKLSKELYKKAAVYQYVIGNNKTSDELFINLLAHSKSKNERAEVLSLEVIKYMKLSMLDKAIDKAVESLKLSNIDMYITPGNEMILHEQSLIENELEKYEFATLLHSPKLTNPAINIAMSTLPNLAMCGYLSGNSALFMFSVLKGVSLSLLNGQSDLTAYMYAWYGLFLVKQQKYQQGYQFGKLALQIAEKYKHCRELGQVYNIFGTCISHYYDPFNVSIDILKKGLQSLSNGDVVAACYCSTNIIVQSHAKGITLAELQKFITSTTILAHQYSVLSAGDISYIYQQFCASLQQGLTSHNLGALDITRLFSNVDDNTATTDSKNIIIPSEQLQRIAASNSLTFYNHCQLQQQFWFRQYSNAINIAQFAQTSLEQTPGYIMNIDHYFIYAMSTAMYYINLDYANSCIPSSPYKTKKLLKLWLQALHDINLKETTSSKLLTYTKLQFILKSYTLKALKKSISISTIHAKNSPTNFKAKLLIMQLVHDWILNNSLDDTIVQSNQILSLLDKFKNLPIKALLNEILCLVLLLKQCPMHAVSCLTNAITAYNEWGALSLSLALNKRHSNLLKNSYNTQAPQNPIIHNEVIDYNAINTLSSVLSTATKEKDIFLSILQNATYLTGASSAYLILKQDKHFLIKAVSKGSNIQTYVNQNVLFNKFCPSNVIDAVTVVLNTNKEILNEYDLIQQDSIEYLVLPILLHGNCLGALYLENEFLDAVFNPKHITILNTLLSQMALTLTSLRELNQSEQRYQSLARLSPVGIFETDEQGRCLYVNKNYEAIAGITAKLALDGGWMCALHPDDADKVIETWLNCIRTRKPCQLEHRFLHQNGDVKWVYTQAAPQYSNNVIKSWIGTVTDMTKLHQAENKLQQQKMELVHYARLNVGGELISGIAHDLNQPLTSIKNYISGSIARLTSANTNPDIIEALQNANNLASRAGNTINTFKDFLTKRPLNKALVNINEVIYEALRLVQFELSTAHITTKVIANNPPTTVTIDKIQIEQALINIVFNAIDALKNNENDNKYLMINIDDDKTDKVNICIEDNGSGIAKKDLSQVFEPFHTTKRSGMGMGLAICYSIIEIHNGHIWAESELGKFTRICFTLPVKTSYN